MAIVQANIPVSMEAASFLDLTGVIPPAFPPNTTVSSAAYRFSNGSTLIAFGSLTYIGATVVGGVATAIQLRDSGNVSKAIFTGLAVPAPTLHALILSGDEPNLLNFLLAGADLVQGSAGSDRLIGLGSNDTLVGNAGDDRLDGGAGIDTASYAGSTGSVTVSLLNTSAQNTGAGLDTLVSIENLLGGSGSDFLTGNGGVNALDGAGGNDTLLGLGGNDTLTGGAGNDLIDGGVGSDTARFLESTAITVDLSLTGVQATGAGSDTLRDIENLIGGGGSTSFLGNDLANRLDGGAGADVLSGRGGKDTLLGGADDDLLIGGAGSDSLDGGTGIDTASYADMTLPVKADLLGGTAISGADTDTLAGIENLIGSGGDDTLTGDKAHNRLDGGSGNDLLSGSGGDDILVGGPGRDTLQGGEGTDTAFYGDDPVAVQATIGGAGPDELSGVENLVGSNFGDLLGGDSRANELRGGGGDDTLDGAAGDDTLDGGAGRDTASFARNSGGVTASLADGGNQVTGDGSDLFVSIEDLLGGSGNDLLIGDGNGNRLTGADGADSLFGSGGDDTLDGGRGDDLLDGGEGTDTADYSSALAALRLDLSGMTLPVAGELGVDTMIAIENLTGGAFADMLSGNDLANRLDGGAGNDSLSGGAGDDTLVGGDGDDNFDPGEGRDSIDGGAGIDRVSYAARTTGVQGAPGFLRVVDSLFVLQDPTQHTLLGDQISAVERVIGSAFADRLFGDDGATRFEGGDGDDLLCGWAGNDVLAGGAGADTLMGGSGNDTFIVTPGATDVLDDRSGNDVIVVPSLAALVSAVRIDGAPSGTLLTEITDGTSNTISFGEATSTGPDDLLLTFSDGTSFVIVNQFQTPGVSAIETLRDAVTGVRVTLASVLTGGDAPGIITGTDGFDRIDGRGGDDLLFGNAGDDTILGGTGSDRIDGGARNDRLDGGAGDDTVAGGTGNDTLTGGKGADSLDGGKGHDRVDGGDGDDRLLGISGDDTLTGGDGNDTAEGGEGHDRIYGGDGDDSLVGNDGPDRLEGGNGNDTLVGGRDDDTLIGGDGADRFVFDAGASDIGRDVIRDFDEGADKVVLLGAGRIDPEDIAVTQFSGKAIVDVSAVFAHASGTDVVTLAGVMSLDLSDILFVA